MKDESLRKLERAYQATGRGFRVLSEEDYNAILKFLKGQRDELIQVLAGDGLFSDDGPLREHYVTKRRYFENLVARLEGDS